MKKLTLSVLCFFTLSIAAAQSSDNIEKADSKKDQIAETTDVHELNTEKNIIVPQDFSGTMVDAEIKEDDQSEENMVAASRNLKMFYVASSLFYTNNYALT